MTQDEILINREDQSRWEQRENLSYMYHLDVNNIDKLNEILSAFMNNESLTWNDLSITEEAYLQKRLRDSGFDLKCFGLNQFPTNISSLKTITFSLPLITRIKQKYYKHRSIFSNILKIFANPSTVSLILIIWGLAYFDSSLGWPALLLSLLIYNLVIIITHDYWAHGFITPKNKFIGYVFDILAYMSEVTLESLFNSHPKQTFKLEHIKHHSNWKIESLSEKDHWAKILFFPSYRLYANKITKYPISENSSFIDKNYLYIVIGLHLCLFFLLGTIYYFYFVFLQGWLYLRWRQFFLELSPHYSQGDWRSQHDHPWLFVLCANGGYHISHHLNQNAIILGNGGIKKYFSIQFWFLYLFYKVRKDIPVI